LVPWESSPWRPSSPQKVEVALDRCVAQIVPLERIVVGGILKILDADVRVAVGVAGVD
jgi:hypothetical protein